MRLLTITVSNFVLADRIPMAKLACFHAGELEAQRRAGTSEEAAGLHEIIGTKLRIGVDRFLITRNALFVSTVDSDGAVWASVLFGNPGFAKAVDSTTLSVRVHENTDPSDPVVVNLLRGSPVGMLLIDFPSRSRFRVNGHASALSNTTSKPPFTSSIRVTEAFPNCPKYIQARTFTATLAAASSSSKSAQSDRKTTSNAVGTKLLQSQQEWIRKADTFFIGSCHPERGADVSHRGGSLSRPR